MERKSRWAHAVKFRAWSACSTLQVWRQRLLDNSQWCGSCGLYQPLHDMHARRPFAHHFGNWNRQLCGAGPPFSSDTVRDLLFHILRHTSAHPTCLFRIRFVEWMSTMEHRVKRVCACRRHAVTRMSTTFLFGDNRTQGHFFVPSPFQSFILACTLTLALAKANWTKSARNSSEYQIRFACLLLLRFSAPSSCRRNSCSLLSWLFFVHENFLAYVGFLGIIDTTERHTK